MKVFRDLLFLLVGYSFGGALKNFGLSDEWGLFYLTLMLFFLLLVLVINTWDLLK